MISLAAVILSVVLLDQTKGGFHVTASCPDDVINPGRSVLLTLKVVPPEGKTVEMPDIGGRTVGFSVAEDFEEGDTSLWRLVPEPCGEVYKIKPFVIGDNWFGPVYFKNPPARETVDGPMEVSPTRDFPPLSWKLAGYAAAGLAVLVLAVWAVYALVRYIARRIREHRMSPIERAWVELDRLLSRGLPGRGRYKDFYIELTMVVRRYVQRKYSVRAPHMTTEEFIREYSLLRPKGIDALRDFLQTADLVKFAGVSATPEMADDAADSARVYLRNDDGEKSTEEVR